MDPRPPPGAPVERVVGQGDLGPYEDLGEIGRGGMAEVHGVRDPRLGRTVAMKIIHAHLMDRPLSVRRFAEEARTTAQLQHPGIVPVHEAGQLPDGRPWFTMREVKGETLQVLLRRVALALRRQDPVPDGWTLRRLVDAFRSACDAVAFAHQRGIVHRDLKPANLMLGAHGEVLVLDWGIAKRVGRIDEDFDDASLDTTGELSTRVGSIQGTPAYMAPEQARGEGWRADRRADVYALGAILFTLLYGERPFARLRGDALIEAAALESPELPPALWPVPIDLENIRAQAMARNREERYPDAGAMAQHLRIWLDGDLKRARALTLVAEAATTLPKAAALRSRASRMEGLVKSALGALAPWAPESEKAPLWELRREVMDLAAAADRVDLAGEQLLERALGHDPELEEAHEALARRWVERHLQAVEARDVRGELRAEALVRLHVDHLPPSRPEARRLRRWLKAEGRVQLELEGEGLRVDLYREEAAPVRLVPRFARSLSPTMLAHGIDLPMGSWRLWLSRGGESGTWLPFVVEREGEASLVDPQGQLRRPRLPAPDELDHHHECLVPEGWFWDGGDPQAVGSGPRTRLWVEAFVMARFPVTNADYLAFLDDLVATGRAEEALRHVPREKPGTSGEAGAIIYGQGENGRFYLREDADGDLWELDWPVIMVDWHGAVAYADWLAACTGKAWRIPTSAEWAKAARGVDGRLHPWGDAFDPCFACMRDSHPGRPNPSSVYAFPTDESPYGVRGLGGNVRAWCEEADVDGKRINRGGFWLGNARDCRSADLHTHMPTHRTAEVGIRLVRSWPG